MNSVYPKSYLAGDKLVFEKPSGLQDAFKYGALYVKIPDEFNAHVIEKFATSYYLDETSDENKDYTGYKDEAYEESKLGYSSPNDQVELLQLESHLWSKYFPGCVYESLNLMERSEERRVGKG